MTAYAALLGAFADALRATGRFGTPLSPKTILPHIETGELPYIQHRHFGAGFAPYHCGPTWEALEVNWLPVEGDRYISGPVTLFLLPGAPAFAQNRLTMRLKLSANTLRAPTFPKRKSDGNAIKIPPSPARL